MDTPATLLFFDLNRFKAINDVYGHAEGDRALQTFARALLAVLRESDVIGRLGGDEFSALLLGPQDHSLDHLTGRLREWLHAHHPAGQFGYQVEFSVGTIPCDPHAHDSIAALLAQADAAMYEHKKSSRSSG